MLVANSSARGCGLAPKIETQMWPTIEATR